MVRGKCPGVPQLCDADSALPAQVTKALVLRYHPLSSHLTDKVGSSEVGRSGRSLPTPPASGQQPKLPWLSFSALSSLQLLGLLSDVELGPTAADGFSLLMAESPDVLHKGCHADVRIMFRQRFFTDNVPKLVQGFHGAGAGEQLAPAWPHHLVPLYPGDLSQHPLLPLATCDHLCLQQM